ncbi:MAG TPA: amidase family protein, partial [Thermomicrobiaceae bacterium]|nr:amidase family protein [Thermomicrobiaceae bacterium]
SAMAGPDRRDPLSIEQSGQQFAQPLERDFQGVTVAWSRDLGGLPVDPRVTAVLERQVEIFEALGCEVEEATPDLRDAEEIFQVLRAYSFAVAHADQLREHRDQLKDTVIWNTEQGLKLSALNVGRAQVKQAELYERVRTFMERYEFLLCPVNQVPPFDVTIPYPTEINGEPMEHYIAWMRSAYYITVTGSPAISVPAGFTKDDPPLPVGLQIVGRFHDDLGVLQLAQAFEHATGAGKRRPPIS